MEEKRSDKQIIHGREFLNWLAADGIIPNECTRVVIDASHDSPVEMYIEKYGTTGLIEVKPPGELRTAIKIEEWKPPDGFKKVGEMVVEMEFTTELEGVVRDVQVYDESKMIAVNADEKGVESLGRFGMVMPAGEERCILWVDIRRWNFRDVVELIKHHQDRGGEA